MKLTVTQTVARALREHCNIPFESFFLATHLGGGKFAYFTGPCPISDDDIRKMFRREKFLQFQHRKPSREYLSQIYEDDYEPDGGHSGCASAPLNGPWQLEPRSTKRRRRQGELRRDHEDDAPPVIIDSKRGLEIGNSKEVSKFYEHRFRCIQQTACKEIAKAFIKVIAPKKQANNPYVKGDALAPDWWPKPLGPGEKDKVRHIEPDHQLKKERVTILTHILGMIIDPETRSPSIQVLGDITVAKLEAAAMDSLSNFFADTSRPKNAEKKPILKELFKVAKMEEAYKRNKIDGTTQVFVTDDDMVMDFCFDEDEVEDEEEELANMGLDRPRADSVTSSQVSPSRTASLPLPPSLSPTSSAVHAMAAQFQAPPFLYDLPIPSTQYSRPVIMSSDLSYAYPGGHNLAAVQPHATAGMQMHDLLAGPHHDTSRHSSLFAPTAEFTAGPSPSAMYHRPRPCSQFPSTSSTATAAASTPETSSPPFAYASAYNYTHQHQEYSQQPVHSLPLPLPLPPSQLAAQKSRRGTGIGELVLIGD